MSDHATRMRIGLDPTASVVVEACAGSGKTWMLVSRLLRILLAGCKPGQILAITYTRKAAREIDNRLRQWLALLATAPEEQVRAFLKERALSDAEISALMPRARNLFEEVLRADPPMTLTTFHGWFGRLLSAAPLASGLSGMSLAENVADLVTQAWADLAAQCSRAPDSPLAQSLLWLYAEVGDWNCRSLLQGFLARRAEWQAYVLASGGATTEAIDAVAEQFGAQEDPLDEFLSATCCADLQTYAGLLGRNTETDKKLGDAIIDALTLHTQGDMPAAFEGIQAALLTGEGKPRARKPSKAQSQRLSPEGEAQLLRLHAQLCEALQATMLALQDRRAALFNSHALRVGQALLDTFEALKRARRVQDFTDLECVVDRLLADEHHAVFIQARLDARYRHVLLDEFQDTNPLQWRILRGWFDGYTAGGITPPAVFMVGDPKQSIYRFRRAEPKLFEAAGAYFAHHFGAHRIINARTFRNAGAVVRVVNEVFGAPEGIRDYPQQDSMREHWPGHVQVLPLIEAETTEVATLSLRDALREPVVELEDARRALEAAQIVAYLREHVGRMEVGVGEGTRALRYSDVLILTRRTTILAPYEKALREANIPYLSPGRGGLLETLEAQDLLALLRFLAYPQGNLSLAHVLRTPAFDLSDSALIAIADAAAAARCSWWEALQTMAQFAGEVALLQGWLATSRVLPAHDLIDKVFHEGHWLARYRSRVPAQMWPGVHANLDALLELALSVDAGRYPSLTRFVDNLERMRTSDDEAPDEGLIGASGHDGGRVRIMTIHGAKGLEAPVVWLIDAHSAAKGLDGYQPVMQWPVDADAPEHFSLLERVGEAGSVRVALLDEERAAMAREALNLLYVAMTRAEQCLVVSGVSSTRTLPDSHYARVAAALARCGAEAGMFGVHLGDTAQSVLTSPAVPAQPLPSLAHTVGVRHVWQPGSQSQAFGTAMHAWLEAKLEGLPAPHVAPEARMMAERILAQPDLARFFDPTRYVRARNESAFILADGSVGRIDRWVDDGSTIWVLDYKSGANPQDSLFAQYQAQVQAYCQALAGVFAGRQVRGLLVLGDGRAVYL